MLDGTSNSEVATNARFIDATATSGVSATYRNGEGAGEFSILESLGGGVALFDVDGDSDLDAFVPCGGQLDGKVVTGNPGRLFKNDGSGRFVDITEESGLNVARHYTHGAAVADYDNDGDSDLLVTGYGGVSLFENSGEGRFTDVTRSAGLSDTAWSSSAAFGDLNGDGSPDLYIAHYVDWSWKNHPRCGGSGVAQRDVCPPKQFVGLGDTLYLNNGDGTFRDATAESGLKPGGKGLGVLMADLDLDGDLDLYVANDTVDNFLYRNDGTAHFEDVALRSGTAYGDRGVSDGSMGVDVGDFNLDGLPDIWVANYEAESFALYRNEGDLLFQHVSQLKGVTLVGAVFVGWGTVFLDFDRDADEDIFVSNGHVIRKPVNAPLKQNPLLFQNEGGRRLINVADQAGEYLRTPHMGRGVAAGDIDSDGDLDLLVSRVNEPVVVLINESSNENHWLMIDVEGTTDSRDAVGTIVTLETEGGTQVRQKKSGTSYSSHSDDRIFFGLGEFSQVMRLEVQWPNGQRQTVDVDGVDRVIKVMQKDVSSTSAESL